jgi:hypothetical protein
MHCHLVELLQVAKQLLLDFGFHLARFPPSGLQVSGILWGHGRLSLAMEALPWLPPLMSSPDSVATFLQL